MRDDEESGGSDKRQATERNRVASPTLVQRCCFFSQLACLSAIPHRDLAQEQGVNGTDGLVVDSKRQQGGEKQQ